MGNMKFLAGAVLGGIAVASILSDEFRISTKHLIEAAGKDLQKQLAITDSTVVDESEKGHNNEN